VLAEPLNGILGERSTDLKSQGKNIEENGKNQKRPLTE
jgi:hypothetical protein